MQKTLIITGCSSGIGRAVARKLLNQYQVIGLSRDCQQFTQTHPNFSPYQLDLSNLETLPKQLKQLAKTYPKIDGVIFCAGYGQFASLEEFSYQQIQSLINTNFTAQVFLTRALLPQLKRQPHSNLIYIGSEAALKGARKGTIYCASKFALRGFTQALREESARSHVSVSLINPGMVRTEFFDELNFEPGDDNNQALLAEDVAEAVIYILNSRTGTVIDEITLNPLNKVVKFKKTD